MNRIDALFHRLKREKQKGLIAYVTAGHPTRGAFAALIRTVVASGADLIEIGVPFSDPIADGPTIQQSSQIALRQGTTLRWILSEVRGLRKTLQTPLVVMSYSNPLLAMGLPQFFATARAAGIDGVIIPDLIPEESQRFNAPARKQGIHMIHLVSPTTPASRLARIAQASRGFLYAVSLTGVTGARQSLPKGVSTFLQTVTRLSPRPVAVGFGISTPQQAKAMAQHADAVIVGSALIRAIEASPAPHFQKARHFVKSLKHALREVPCR